MLLRLYGSMIQYSNSFASLSTLSSDTNFPLSPPAATSSPKVSGHRNAHNNHSSQSNDRATNRKQTGMRRQAIKVMVFNFDGLENKTAELATSIETYHPDVIIASETHLKDGINSSELFPPEFSVYRKDRVKCKKGGVLIATRNDLIATHRVDLDTDCEVVWVTIKIQGSKDITIGAFYRSQIFGKDPAYMNELRVNR